MKKLLTPLFLLSAINSFSQNVGIGTLNPAMRLHIASNDSAVLMLQTNANLLPDLKTAIYFKTNNWYTASIQSIGTGVNEARLGFFTFAGPNANNLKESMTITDLGKVGIGKTDPTYELDLNGSLNLTGQFLVDGDPGVSGQILVSKGNSTPPKWSNGPGGQGFQTYINGNQNINVGTATIIDFASPFSNFVSFNNGGVFNDANDAFAPSIDGIYLMMASARVVPQSAGFTTIEIVDITNNSVYATSRLYLDRPNEPVTVQCSAALYLTGGTSFFCRVRNQTSTTLTVLDTSDSFYSALLIKED